MGENIVIGDDVKIGHRVNFGSFVVIENGVVIEDGVKIENFVEIMEGCHIGADCTIRSFTRLGPHTKIGKNVTVKCSAITGPYTDIRDRAFIGPQAIFFSRLDNGESRTVVMEDAFVGGGARVMPGLVIGECSIVGAGSFVKGDVKPKTKVVGSPAKEV